MKKCELLCPAGNMDMLKYAVLYGADAVYLAGTKFGARKFANNFNEEEMVEAVKFAHLYGVKVYVTINTLIYENEIEEFLNYATYIHKIGVDAVLVQDMGMLKLLHETLPNLELHASTQMHNNSSDMISLLKRYGVKRVVLDREMSLKEIKMLPSDIEIEVFCHGALCVSYSGQCLLSSMILNRSGNRGECAGMCRLPYRLCMNGKVDNESKYYLSLKDLCTVSYIDKILDSGVASLKIEGRMKSPQYVGYMTKIYRRLIDSYYEDNFSSVTDEEMKNIKILFNRGFTRGFMDDTNNDGMANIANPNHMGISIGTYKFEGKRIKIFLSDTLVQGDVIRFKEDNKGMTVNFLYDQKGNLINSANKGHVVFVDNFLDLEHNGEVRLVSSVILNNEIDNLPKRKVTVQGEIWIQNGKKIKLLVNDGKNEVIVEGVVPSIALNRPITINDVTKQIEKTGNTIYEFTDLNVNLDDNMYVNIKDLNELRRDAFETLNKKRSTVQKQVIIGVSLNNFNKTERKNTLNVIVNNEEQLKVASKYADNIFTSNEDLFTKNGEGYVHLKYEENAKKLEFSEYVIGDYGSLTNVKKKDIVHTDYMLNVVNSYSANNLLNMGVNTICLSPELTISKIEDLVSNTDASSLEVLVYGHVELMKMKYDPISVENAQLVDRNNSRYFIKRGKKLNYLMSPKPIDRIAEIERIMKLGIKNYRVDFLNETKEDCEKILSNIHKNFL